jgi:hypothetical protein
MQKFRWVIAAAAVTLLATGCAKKEEATAEAAAAAETAPPAEAAAPAAEAAPAPAEAPAAVVDEDGSQSGGDKIRP